MAFNIKNQATHDLAREVADLTGESMAQAVDQALRERRDRLKRRGMADRLNQIARETAPHFPADFDMQAAMDDLYDDKGLPR